MDMADAENTPGCCTDGYNWCIGFRHWNVSETSWDSAAEILAQVVVVVVMSMLGLEANLGFPCLAEEAACCHCPPPRAEPFHV